MIKVKYIWNSLSVVLVIVTYSILTYLSKQATIDVENETSFVVKFPKILDLAGKLCVFIGTIVEIIFLYKNFKHDSDITKGHFWLGACFIVGGLFLAVACARWSVVVDGNMITCNRIFKSSTTINLEDLDDVILTGGTVKLTSGGKTLTSVDKDCDNYDRLYGKLSEYGKIN